MIRKLRYIVFVFVIMPYYTGSDASVEIINIITTDLIIIIMFIIINLTITIIMMMKTSELWNDWWQKKPSSFLPSHLQLETHSAPYLVLSTHCSTVPSALHFRLSQKLSVSFPQPLLQVWPSPATMRTAIVIIPRYLCIFSCRSE